MRYIVTGGYGFIGSAVVRQLAGAGHDVFNLDKKTYAANPAAIDGLAVQNVHACITDRAAIAALFKAARPDAVIHLAAETHVDRSIDGPSAFMTTNVDGTFSLLEAALGWWKDADRPADFRFVHVSTDEVFGDLGPDDPVFDEHTAYAPSSPYSASKASSDHLGPVMATDLWIADTGDQLLEQLRPLAECRKAHSDSDPQSRPWRSDFQFMEMGKMSAIGFMSKIMPAALLMPAKADAGSTLLFGARAERTNLDLVNAICATLDELRPKSEPYSEQIQFVTDRKGHDRRYGVDPSSAELASDWRPERSLEEGLRSTVEWYIANLSDDPGDADDRLGLSRD